MTEPHAYRIISTLIPQLTWGGNYISQFKNLPNHIANLKIGQSYELFSNTLLADKTYSGEFFEISDTPYKNRYKVPENTLTLASLIKSNPSQVLGSVTDKKFKSKLDTLIKFTQAKGNSFQVHVKKGSEFGHWRTKPESWYYLEKGIATVGIKDVSKLTQFKHVCLAIETFIAEKSLAVKNNTITIDQAKSEIKSFIQSNSPYEFVNTIAIDKNAILDLHKGGTHHSWEEDESKYPLGNIVYEVQADVPDGECTLRCFDRGKLSDDGSFRPVHVIDYFKALDISTFSNNPNSILSKTKLISISNQVIIRQIFQTPSYCLDEMEFTGTLDTDQTNTNDLSFHHLFVKDGEVRYLDNSVELTLSKGQSLFIPACVIDYSLKANKKTVVLKTYVN